MDTLSGETTLQYSIFLFPCGSKALWEELLHQKQSRLLFLTLLHSETPKLYTILAFLSAIGLKEYYDNIVVYLVATTDIT